jgi:hypothetical protein
MALHKKHRKGSAARASARQKQPRWLWMVLVGLVLAGGAFLVVLASRSSQVSNYKPETTGSARVSVSQDKIDYGDVKLGRTINTVFDVRNVGDQDLVIQDEPRVELVEGC